MPEAVKTSCGGSDPYAGLRELARQSLACVGQEIANARAADLRARGGGPGLLDDLKWLFEQINANLSMSNVTWWLRYQVVEPAAYWVQANLFNPLHGLGSTLVNILTWYISQSTTSLYNALVYVPGVIAAAVNYAPILLANSLAGILGGLVPNLATLVQVLWTVATNAPAWVSSPVNALAQSVAGALFNSAPLLGSFIKLLGDGSIGALWNLGTTLTNPMYHLVNAGNLLAGLMSPGLGMAGIGSLTNLYNTAIAALRQWWAGAMPQLAAKTDEAIRVARPVIEQLWAGFQSLPSTFLDWVAANAGTDLAMRPAQALTTTGTLYGISIAAGAAAHTISAALNLIPTLNWVGAGQLAAYVAEVAAFQPLTNATYGVLINDCLATPLRYHWNQQLRPRLPSEGEIFIMGRKHGITYDEFKTAMAYQGLPDWWIDTMYDFFWTDPSPMWLLRMCESGVPRLEDPRGKRDWLDQWLPNWQNDPLAWLRMKLMLAGFEDVDIDPMMRSMTARAMSSPVTQFKTSVRALLREGYWSEADAQAALEPYNARSEEVHALAVAEELSYQKSYLDDQVAYYKESFRKGQLSEQDLTLALSTIFTREDRVVQEVARERVRKLPTPKVKTEPTEPPEVTKLRTQAVTSWTTAYRAWKISEADLQLGLSIVVNDPDLAQKMVLAELTRYREPPKAPAPPKEPAEITAARRQAIATWVEAYRDGKIDDVMLEIQLRPLVPDAATRRTLVELESYRYRAAPPPAPPAPEPAELVRLRDAAVQSWLSQYRKWVINEGELEAGLYLIVMDHDLARSMVEAERKAYRAPLPTPPPPAEDPGIAAARRQAIATWVQSLRDGTISKDQLELYLQPLIPDETIRRQLVALEQLRYNPAPDLLARAEENAELAKVRAEHVRGHCEMFQKRLIDVDTLYTYLQADGLSEQLARATVITQANKRIKVPSPDSLIYRDDVVADLADAGAAGYEQLYLDGAINLETYAAWLECIVHDPDVAAYLADALELRKFASAL